MASERPGRAPVTVHDVAAHAGVSTATVSRALSGSRPMSAELRQRVLVSAQALGYSVNLLGRGLRQKRTFSLGLVVPDLENPFFSALAQQVSRSFSRASMDVYTCSADNDLGLERRGIQSFLGRQVDGIVVIPCHEFDSAANVALANESPVAIQLDRMVRSVKTHTVGCDNRHGMKLLVEHVKEVDLDRQPPIFIGAEATSSTAHERLDAFVKSFPVAPRLLGSFSFDWGQAATTELINNGVATATIVTAADVIALGAIAAVQKHHFRVPDDFRVTGFDDVGVSHLAHPPLTTVRQSVDQMTGSIVDIVTARFADAEPQEQIRMKFKPRLVVRASSPRR